MNNFSQFFTNIKLKKQYINSLKSEINKLNINKSKSYKNLNINEKDFSRTKENHLIKYIIDVTFSKKNTLIHVMDFSGNLKFFCSAGLVSYKGKQKKARYQVFNDLYKLLKKKFRFIRYQPVVLHLKNVKTFKYFIVKSLKKYFYVKAVKTFTRYPYNGCRQKKLRRKKIRT